MPTSSAWLGPDITATSASGSSSSMISERVSIVCSSIPLATLTISWPGFKKAFMERAVLLVKAEGTARTSTSLSVMAFLRSLVISIFSGRITPGSFVSCCRFVRSISTSSFMMDQIVTSCPFLSHRSARAVPQLPAPIIPIFAIIDTSVIFYFCCWKDKSFSPLREGDGRYFLCVSSKP